MGKLKAENYIKLTQADIEAITPKRYCENNTVNLILSYFELKARIRAYCLVWRPDASGYSFIRNGVCALLSNGLKMRSMLPSHVADEQFRRVKVRCHIHTKQPAYLY